MEAPLALLAGLFFVVLVVGGVFSAAAMIIVAVDFAA